MKRIELGHSTKTPESRNETHTDQTLSLLPARLDATYYLLAGTPTLFKVALPAY